MGELLGAFLGAFGGLLGAFLGVEKLNKNTLPEHTSQAHYKNTLPEMPWNATIIGDDCVLGAPRTTAS